MQIHIHGDELNSFFNEFPKDFLPVDLGGTAPPYNGREVAKMIFGTSVSLWVYDVGYHINQFSDRVIPVEMALEGRRTSAAIFLVLHATQDWLRQFQISTWCSNM